MNGMTRLAAALASLCLGACIFGGTGTDTENGVGEAKKDNLTISIKGVSARVVDGEGRPLKGVNLFLFDTDYRPDSGRAPEPLLSDPVKPLVTDTMGYVTLNLRGPGKYVVEGVSAGQTVFFDTLAAPDILVATPFTFRARAVSAFQGQVKLVSGMRIDSGLVFIRGTSRSVKVDATGHYNLGSLPSDVGRMALGMRYGASPTSVRESKQATVDSLKVPISMTPIYTCKDVPNDSAARITANPARAANALQPDMAGKSTVDTSKVSPALKACDTLPKGSVVNVVSKAPPGGPVGMNPDSISVPVLVLLDEKAVTSLYGQKIIPAKVISYADCVTSAGKETTSFDLKLQSVGAASDLLVQDVAAKCLDK